MCCKMFRSDTLSRKLLVVTCCGPLPAEPQLVREAEVALGAQAAGQRRHRFQLPVAAACAGTAVAHSAVAAAAAAAAIWGCHVEGCPQAAGVEAAPPQVCDVPASASPCDNPPS